MKLYEFQEIGLAAGRNHYRRGKKAGLFVGPTGMGKTVLFSAAAKGHYDKGGHVVVVVHRRELLAQTASTLERLGLEVGWLGRRANARVQVTSIQTILASRVMPKATLAIFDEAHHYAADEWSLAPLEYLKAGAILFGATATPERDDGRGLGTIFDFLVVVASVSDLVALNATDDTKGITPIRVVDPKRMPRRLGQYPVDAYLEYTPRGHAVVFAPDVKNAKAFADQFAAKGIAAPVVYGDLPVAERDDAIKRFANGDVRVLVNVNVLTEGWDAPICDTCILARKIGSFSLYFQTIGRARRARGGKKLSHLIDLAGNVDTHGHPDDEICYSLDGVGMSSGRGSATPGPRQCRRCSRVLDDDIRAARLLGSELTHCPECKLKLSRIELLTSEDIELQEIVRDAEKRATKIDTRVRALATLYEKAAAQGKDKNGAHFAYKNIFKAGFPPSDVRARAWRIAVERMAARKGESWDHGPDPTDVDDRDPEVERV